MLAHLRNAKQLIHTHPKILRVRKDITWQEVLQNWRHNIYRLDYAGTKYIIYFILFYWFVLFIFSIIVPSQKALHAPSEFTNTTNQKMKTLLLSFAKKHAFDPCVLENWLVYTTYSTILQEVSVHFNLGLVISYI